MARLWSCLASARGNSGGQAAVGAKGEGLHGEAAELWHFLSDSVEERLAQWWWSEVGDGGTKTREQWQTRSQLVCFPPSPQGQGR